MDTSWCDGEHVQVVKITNDRPLAAYPLDKELPSYLELMDGPLPRDHWHMGGNDD